MTPLAIGLTIAALVIIVGGIFLYAACLAGRTADNQSERFWRDISGDE